jgi:hypothetical protein
MNYVGISEAANVFSDEVQVQTASVNLQFGAVYNVVMGEEMVRKFPLTFNKSKLALRRRKEEFRLKVDEPYPEGMWGLGFPALNSLGSTPLFDQLVDSGYSENLFTMCLRNIGGTISRQTCPPKISSPIFRYFFQLPPNFSQVTNSH